MARIEVAHPSVSPPVLSPRQHRLLTNLFSLQALGTLAFLLVNSAYAILAANTALWLMSAATLALALVGLWAWWAGWRGQLNLRQVALGVNANLLALFFILLLVGPSIAVVVVYIWVMLLAGATFDRELVARTGLLIFASVAVGALLAAVVPGLPLVANSPNLPPWAAPLINLAVLGGLLAVAWLFITSVLQNQEAVNAQLIEVSQMLHEAAHQQAAHATEQAANVAEVATSMEEMNRANDQISRAIEQLADESVAMQARIEQATLDLEQTVAAMAAVKELNESLAQQVQNMRSVADDIAGALKIIKDFASQTHLLALNARIEAAGSGEMGRRFSVVANQIKQLADEALYATTEIRDLVERSQTFITPAVSVAGTTAARAEEGLVLTRAFQSVMRDLSGSTTDNVNRVMQIRQATEEQQYVGEQLALAMTESRTLIRELAQQGQEVAAAADQLRALTMARHDT